MSQTYTRKPGEAWADITVIEPGRFLIDFTPRGLELLELIASYPEAAVPPEDLAEVALTRVIEENLEWSAAELQDDNTPQTTASALYPEDIY